jgi:carbamoyltransferase
MRIVILGISAYYHDSAAALVIDGEIVAAAQEERFTRVKQDASFPANAIQYVLDEGGVSPGELTAVSFYEKPFIKFERLLETYHAFVPRGLASFTSAMTSWMKDKLFMKSTIRKELSKLGFGRIQILFPEHHLSHAASAFFPSPYTESAILTIDGVGEWATTTIAKGNGNQISVLKELQFPHSLGLLYSAFTYYTGFRVNSGEYKLMGLAPYGNPQSAQTQKYIRLILENLVDLKDDGSFLLNMDYFEFASGLRMTNNNRWQKLFGIPVREPETLIGQEYMDMAYAIQHVTDEIVVGLARHAKEITNSKNLVMAGGVALNCVSNARIREKGYFDGIWVQPASGDAGGAVGAALAAYYIGFGGKREDSVEDRMKGSLLGPAYSEKDIKKVISKYKAEAEYFENFDELAAKSASLLNKGNIIGWFHGRMEFGPRALGNRSILGDARNSEMQMKLNLSIKFREGFRPFAPSVLEENCGDFFDMKEDSPYMLFVAPVKERLRAPEPENYAAMDLYSRLYHVRSNIPAITHIDYSSRIQTVSKTVNPRYYRLIQSFRELTGYGLIVNTSFNVRGEPIVCSPEDAYKCFMLTGMDYLVIENFLFCKKSQPPFTGKLSGERLD